MATVPRRPSAHVFDGALFIEFLKVGLSGFGGVLPFARRMLVERRRWLAEQEFNEVLSLSQFLPGPNIVNVSIIIGRRFQGPLGALAATAGADADAARRSCCCSPRCLRAVRADRRGARRLHGVSAAAAGLMLAMGLKMARPIARHAWQIGVALVAFVAIGSRAAAALGARGARAALGGDRWWRRG